MSSSEEEEEMLVHVDFNGMLEKDVLNSSPVFKMIGVEGDKPVMQIGNQTFVGEYQDIVGTSLFFEEDPTPPGVDPVFTKTAEHQLRYVCKTRKMLHMSRVFLKRKDEDGMKGEGEEGLESDVEDNVTSETRFLQANSSDEFTMEIDEDPVLLEEKKSSKKSEKDVGNISVPVTQHQSTSDTVAEEVKTNSDNITERLETTLKEKMLFAEDTNSVTQGDSKESVKDTEDLEMLMQATTSGVASKEVEKLVEEKIRTVTSISEAENTD